MITIKNLTKKYGSIYAIKDLSFEVQEGEVIGFLGPNGAGKSTTMNILAGCIPATSGEASIAGHSIMGEPLEVKKRIGYLPEIPPLYQDMRVIEYLKYVAKLKRVPKKEIPNQLEYVIEKLKIEDVKCRKIKNLSKGYKQRVGFAQAILGHPDVLILDEPTVGLDPEQIIEIRELIKNLGGEHTVILSSHILSEISAVCSKVIIINNGEIVAVDTPSNLSRMLDVKKKLVVVLESSMDATFDLLKTVNGVENVIFIEEKDGCVTYELECVKDVDVEKNIFFVLVNEQIPLKEIKNVEVSLEDVFLEIIRSNKKFNEEPVNAEDVADISEEDSNKGEEVEEIDSNESEEVEEIDSNESEEVEEIDSNESEEVEEIDSNESEEIEEIDSNESEINKDQKDDVVQQEDEEDKNDTNI